MVESLIILTGIVIAGFSLGGLKRSRDPLFPLVIMGPMLLYVYVYQPLVSVTAPTRVQIFPSLEPLVMVHVVNLLAVSAFCVGCIWHRRPRGVDHRFDVLRQELGPRIRNRIFSLGIILGLLACGSFAFMVQYSGGWTKVFSVAKPFVRGPSGYIGEMPMLSYPAVFLLAISFQGRRLTPVRILTMILVLMPHVIMATIGGRRGPTFLVTCSLVGAWCIIRQRPPKVRSILVGLGAVGCLMLLLQSNRNNLFKFWDRSDLDLTGIEQLWSPPQLTYGDEYVVATATIITSSELAHHYWGVRYFAQFVVRPFPRFLWPSKYEDLGVGWMATDPGKSGISTSEWLDVVGFEPAGGSAGGLVMDLFLEFSWGAIPVCFLLGLMFSSIWKRWVSRGGIWTLIYVEMMILSVYLITQSVGAWLYRTMLLVGMTWIFWRTNMPRQRQVRQMPRARSMKPPGYGVPLAKHPIR
ncbi:MAG: oligosaccharide repeat unit polymerase [Planctomycetaceae bacterium]|nr:oligosaccharide repeat unit polymerase [Planctomycetaceae bacterium]